MYDATCYELCYSYGGDIWPENDAIPHLTSLPVLIAPMTKLSQQNTPIVQAFGSQCIRVYSITSNFIEYHLTKMTTTMVSIHGPSSQSFND